MEPSKVYIKSIKNYILQYILKTLLLPCSTCSYTIIHFLPLPCYCRVLSYFQLIIYIHLPSQWTGKDLRLKILLIHCITKSPRKSSGRQVSQRLRPWPSTDLKDLQSEFKGEVEPRHKKIRQGNQICFLKQRRKNQSRNK